MRFSTALSVAVSALSVARLAAAHGYVESVTIAGKKYDGWLPFTSPYSDPPAKSIVRKVPDDGPITDMSNAGLACNVGGEAPSALSADVNAGSDVKLTWNVWPADHKGPISIYMASCGSSCNSFDPTKGKVWFKVADETLANGVWPTDKLIANDFTWTATVPSGLKPGPYLLRMEILALHSAGAPQVYPSCTTLNVKGSGSDVASASSLVAFPGAYAKAGTALFGNIWTNLPATWPVAGPAVVSFASGGQGQGNAGSSSSAAPTSTKAATTKAAAVTTTAKASASAVHASASPSPSPVSTSAKPSSTAKQCKRKVNSAAAQKRAAEAELRNIIAREAYNREAAVQEAQEAKRSADAAAAAAPRSWASHAKAKRARSLLRE